MRYQVVLLTKEDVQAVEYVEAPNRTEASYRAAMQLENRGMAIRCVKAVRKAA